VTNKISRAPATIRDRNAYRDATFANKILHLPCRVCCCLWATEVAKSSWPAPEHPARRCSACVRPARAPSGPRRFGRRLCTGHITTTLTSDRLRGTLRAKGSREWTSIYVNGLGFEPHEYKKNTTHSTCSSRICM
jgi:hypothetical protein